MYRAAIDVSATHANTLYNYAVLLDSHLKRKDEAEVLYRKCLETQPRHAFALYNLAVLREEIVNNLCHKSSLAKHAISVLKAKDDSSEETAKEIESQTHSVIAEEKEQEMLTDVSKLYERAVEADSNDFTALADCGRSVYCMELCVQH
jgi:tetratricopeptide (TPR) repeat protein